MKHLPMASSAYLGQHVYFSHEYPSESSKRAALPLINLIKTIFVASIRSAWRTCGHKGATGHGYLGLPLW